jgi:hypothetical protein
MSDTGNRPNLRDNSTPTSSTSSTPRHSKTPSIDEHYLNSLKAQQSQPKSNEAKEATTSSISDYTNPAPTTLHTTGLSGIKKSSLLNTMVSAGSEENFTSSTSSKSSLTSAINLANPVKKKPASKKRVKFDTETMLLHLCQFGDMEDPIGLRNVRGCIGLTSSPSLPLPSPSLAPKATSNPPKEILDVNQIRSPAQGLTPLHLAATYGHSTIVNLLLSEAGAAVNLRDIEGWTPLHCACAEGHVEVIKMLGRAQRKSTENGERDSGAAVDSNGLLLYAPPDGPIDLLAENEDGETPQEACLDDKREEISAILRGKFFLF